MGQYRRLGASLAYDRERFTMDDAYIEAVMRFFVHSWERGWIYRANRIVNWCPYHETAISDLEVVHSPMDDTLTSARYPFADGSGSITVATARPATILADVAVAVHPDDDRYREAVGKEVVVPFVGRRVPVVADDLVDPEFGTGRAQGHAGPRPDRLRDRAQARSPGADGDRPRRPHERRRGRPGRPHAEGSRRGCDLVARGARAAGGAGALPSQRGHLRALPQPHRAARLAPVVAGDGGAAQARPCRH